MILQQIVERIPVTYSVYAKQHNMPTVIQVIVSNTNSTLFVLLILFWASIFYLFSNKYYHFNAKEKSTNKDKRERCLIFAVSNFHTTDDVCYSQGLI